MAWYGAKKSSGTTWCRAYTCSVENNQSVGNLHYQFKSEIHKHKGIYLGFNTLTRYTQVTQMTHIQL